MNGPKWAPVNLKDPKWIYISSNEPKWVQISLNKVTRALMKSNDHM